jgi:TetR/AcrR family fatty acid metabolism transcriptional regulator
MAFQIPLVDKKASSEKYQRIIQAAIKVFSQKGFFHAKVADVAKAADVADGTIYLYFKNKDDLLVSIFEHSMDYFIQQTTAELAKLSEPEEKLKTFITFHLQAVKKNPNLAQVLQVELRSSSKFMKEYKPEKFFEYLRLLENIIVEGQEKGVFNGNVNVGMVKRAIFGAVDELALEWVLTKKKRYEIEEATGSLLDLLLKGIRRQVV